LLLVAWLPHWTATDYRRSGPPWRDALADAARACEGRSLEEVEVIISPSRPVADRDWTVRLPCSDVSEAADGA
jgi:hypothetical protein